MHKVILTQTAIRNVSEGFDEWHPADRGVWSEKACVILSQVLKVKHAAQPKFIVLSMTVLICLWSAIAVAEDIIFFLGRPAILLSHSCERDISGAPGNVFKFGLENELIRFRWSELRSLWPRKTRFSDLANIS